MNIQKVKNWSEVGGIWDYFYDNWDGYIVTLPNNKIIKLLIETDDSTGCCCANADYDEKGTIELVNSENEEQTIMEMKLGNFCISVWKNKEFCSEKCKDVMYQDCDGNKHTYII